MVKQQEEKAASIADLQVDPKAKLSESMKTKLINIVVSEFSNQRTRYSLNEEAAKEKLLAAFRKNSGFEALKKKLIVVESEIKMLSLKSQEIEEQINDLGLSKDGSINHYSRNLTPAREEAINKLRSDINALSSMSAETVKNKIITRLILSTTMGEAMVIVHEVMGNNLIPTFTTKQLAYNPGE